MKIHEYLIERDQRRTRIMYHGTSDAYLGSILKHGLLANPPQKGFGSDEKGFESFGGIYLTPKKGYAEKAAMDVTNNNFGSVPILVKVQYVVSSGGPDEDTFFNKFIRIGLTNSDNYPEYNKFINASASEAIGFIKKTSRPTLATVDYIKEFYKELHRYVKKYFPFSVSELESRASDVAATLINDPDYINKASDILISEINLDALKIHPASVGTAKSYVRNVFKHLKLNQKSNANSTLTAYLESFLVFLWSHASTVDTFNVREDLKLRDCVRRILNSTKDTSKVRDEIRINRDIKFKGKTRILEISNIDTGEILYPKYKT